MPQQAESVGFNGVGFSGVGFSGVGFIPTLLKCRIAPHF